MIITGLLTMNPITIASFGQSPFQNMPPRLFALSGKAKNTCLCSPAPTGTIVSIGIDGLEFLCLDMFFYFHNMSVCCHSLRS